MELPKNITQIGETNPHCKIYVEDYVISYVKQMNQHARDKNLAVALYGIRKEEDGVTYLFLYGACKLTFLQKECRHLSQAVQQETEKQRRKYFPDYAFLGYRLLDGEMVEGFHVCEQDVCRYVEGYAQFYEKNDSMLSFMVDERQEEVKPECLDQEKYDTVKKRQEERRVTAEDRIRKMVRYRILPLRAKAAAAAPPAEDRLRRMKLTAAAAFVLLCVVGLAMAGDEARMQDLRAAIGRLVDGMEEQQLPDVLAAANPSAQTGIIVTEDRLTDALLKENAAAGAGNGETGGTQEPVPSAQPERPVESAAPNEAASPAPDAVPGPTPAPAPSPEPSPGSAEVFASAPVPYTVKKGDTLIGICIQRYGSAARLSEICTLNNIKNPDRIKAGAKILLPQ